MLTEQCQSSAEERKMEARERARAYYNARKDDPAFQQKCRDRTRAYVLAHPEKIAASRARGKERRAEYNATYRAKKLFENPTYYLDNKRDTVAQRPQHYRAQKAAWDLANKVRVRSEAKALYAARRAAEPEAIKAENKARYAANADYYKAAAAAWNSANRARRSATEKAWREANPAKAKALKQRARDKAKNDPYQRLVASLRARLKELIRKGRMAQKSQRFRSLIGCSDAELRHHIEKQFLPGMSWDNRPEWHVDHIRPIYTFDLNDSDQQRVCFHFTNLRPLWAAQNLKRRRPNERQHQIQIDERVAGSL